MYIESINLSIMIDGKAIDVTYKGWTKIHNLYKNAMIIQKTYLMLTSLSVVLPCIFVQQDLIESPSSY
jgi:hypothetical protein